MKALSVADYTVFMTVNKKLAFDAEYIAESKDLTHQRDHFKTCSNNCLTLAKAESYLHNLFTNSIAP